MSKGRKGLERAEEHVRGWSSQMRDGGIKSLIEAKEFAQMEYSSCPMFPLD